MRVNNLKVNPAFLPLWESNKKYWFAHGGRGSGKSYAEADRLIDYARSETCRILCTREIQNSIKESVYTLLEKRINTQGVHAEFKFTRSEIRHRGTGSVFLFAGLREHDADSIKGFEDVKYCWVEEAHAVSKKSLGILIPTIRVNGCRICFTYNRYAEFDPVHIYFRRELAESRKVRWQNPDGQILEWEEYTGEDADGVFINHDGNPWFPETLEKERAKDESGDPEIYPHTWKGQPVSQQTNAILNRNDVLDAMKRDVKAEGAKEVGADIARYGDDHTYAYRRHGFKIVASYDRTKQSTTITSRDLMDFSQGKFNKIKVDDTGVGGGVTDNLRAAGWSAVPINFNNKAEDPDKYNMVISEMWFVVRDLLPELDIPDDPDLLEELCGRLYYIDSKGRRCVESKADFKKRYGRSPDKADALLLCFYTGKNMQYDDKIKKQMADRRKAGR